MKRREMIRRLGLGATGLLLGSGRRSLPQTVAADRLDDLASRIREAPPQRIFDVATDAIVGGARPRDLLGAVFLAGVHDVQPRPVGGNLHSVMSVEAGYRLAEVATHRESWQVALWMLEEFKGTQRERGEPWVLPPAPQVEFNSEAAARRALIHALETWDEPAADRAIVGLLPYHDRDSLFEILWPYASRCITYLGHKIVYAAMTEAVLRRLEWRRAQPVARSLVYALVGNASDEAPLPFRRRGPLTDAYQHALGLQDSFPRKWMKRRDSDPAESASIRDALLTGSYRDAQRTVIDATRAGLAPDTIWDGVRLAASELFRRRRSNDARSGEAIRAVHTVTEIWSFGHAWRSTTEERTKRLLLLQAAAWVPELRDALVAREAILRTDDGPDAAAVASERPPTTVRELLEGGNPSLARTFLERDPNRATEYVAGVRSHLGRRAIEYHQFKYAVALNDESRQMHPRWVPGLLAPAVGYTPTAGTSDNGLAVRARSALRAAGV